MPVLSDSSILLEIESENIIIYPFNKRNLNTSSYDVCLGEHFFREHKPEKLSDTDTYNPWCELDVDSVWGEPRQAQSAFRVLCEAQLSKKGITTTDRVIVVEPGETILAHTKEFIGGRDHITTMMKARSSLGRNFIEVCKCAGWGDVGFFNRWTMEITNNSRYRSVILIVGRRIAQIVFFETDEILGSDYSKNGKYQLSDKLLEVKKEWTPYSMLPKLFQDREIV